MGNLSREERKIADFFQPLAPRRYPHGRDVLLAGDQPTGVYFIKSGFVRKYDISAKSGLELTTHTFGPGSLFPLTWALADVSNRNFYAAMGEVELLLAPKRQLKQFLLKNPDVLFSLCSHLLTGIDTLNTRIKYLALGDSHQKIYAELLHLSRRLGEQRGKTVIIKHAFTHQNIANLTGMARETVSHILEELHKQGLITDEHHQITINDIAKMERLAHL